jgi:hypothetical protein
MLAVIFLALGAQAVIADKDVPVVLDTLVEFIASADDTFYGRSLSSRPFFLSTQTNAAFREVAPRLSTVPPTGRQHVTRSTDEVVDCRRPGGPCEITDDGVLLTIEKIVAGAKPGEYEFYVNVKWNDRASEGGLSNRLVKLTIAKVNDVWRVTDDMYMVFTK